ncbi:MAG: N-acetylmannosamine-6-phosphate 2-epimerase [Turicibacter sp.]|nr:N-acetylmannosamine-6-phosphate 2-epimerase [Turicibacter sp.]
MRKQALIHALKGGLVVSCQTQPEDPIHGTDFVVKMAKAAKWAGAVGIRANSPEQIRAIRNEVDLPIIGLWKIDHPDSEVFITPTLAAAKAVFEAGADVIALDATNQMTSEQTKGYELIAKVRAAIPEALIFADVATLDEAQQAVACGADIVAPTLRGYTKDTAGALCPDFALLKRMSDELGQRACVAMEGQVGTPLEARTCLENGAHFVVVGSAITRPHLIAKGFVDRMKTTQKTDA